MFHASVTPTARCARESRAPLGRLLCLLLLAGAWGVSPRGAAAQNPAARTTAVTPVSSKINVDGILDEPAWRTSPTIGDLVQREPATGAPPTEPTNVWLLADRDYLYVGVMAFDSEPDRIVAQEMTRDAMLRSEDHVELILDTYGDGRSAYYFATSAAGALVDGLIYSNGQSNLDWDAIWTVRTHRTADGWSAEFAIPFKSLTFPDGGDAWGFNFSRTVTRKLEESRWTGARLETVFFQVSQAGRITGLTPAPQGIGLDVRPFVAGRALRTGPDRENELTGKPGLDLFYNLAPGIKLSATVNTDFGETEADARQINLTRFSLMYPEKRAFFLEDAGVFSFSNTATAAPFYLGTAHAEVIPFFSRQVGLVRNEEVPIAAGAKLTGRIGRSELGILDVRTGDSDLAPGRNFFVGRVKRNILQESYVGAVFVSGNAAQDSTSQTFGGDLRLATSHLFGKSRNLVLNAFALQSRNEGVTDDDLSYGVSLEYPNDLFEAEVIWRDIQRNFSPRAGFVARNNIRLFRIGGRYNPRPKHLLGLQQMYNGVFYNRYWRLDTGETEAWNLFFTIPLDWHFKSGDGLHSLLSPDVTYNRLFAPFEIAPGVILPAGEYRFTRWSNGFTTAGKRRLQGAIRWWFGTYWSGHAHELQTTLTYKIRPRFTFSQNTNQTFARLPQGNFVARIYSAQALFAASPFLTFSNLAQFDNRSHNLAWQGRVRWTLTPGSDLFLAFNQGWIQDPAGGEDRFRTGDGKVSGKLQYTLRF